MHCIFPPNHRQPSRAEITTCTIQQTAIVFFLCRLSSLMKPNLWTYKFFEVSGHNLESSQAWGILYCTMFTLQTRFKLQYFCSRGGGSKTVRGGHTQIHHKHFLTICTRLRNSGRTKIRNNAPVYTKHFDCFVNSNAKFTAKKCAKNTRVASWLCSVKTVYPCVLVCPSTWRSS